MKLEFEQIKKCEICGLECKNVTSLGAHIQYNHKGYNTKKYYNEFYKQDESEDKCKICGKETRFMGILKGYQEYCGKSCAHKSEHFRKRFNESLSKKTEEEIKNWRDKATQSKISKSSVGKAISNEELRRREERTLKKFKSMFTYITEYHNKKVKGICPICNQVFEIPKWIVTGRYKSHMDLCTLCTPIKYTQKIGKSQGELELYNFISENYKGTMVSNNRTVLEGFELDIWLPELNVAFEYDGTYWHADPRKYKEDDIINDKKAKDIWKYDKMKDNFCKKKNIKLYRIKEIDWFENRKMIENKIISYLRQ